MIIITFLFTYTFTPIYIMLQLIEKIQAHAGTGHGEIYFTLNSNIINVVRIGQLTLSQQIRYGLY